MQDPSVLSDPELRSEALNQLLQRNKQKKYRRYVVYLILYILITGAILYGFGKQLLG